MFDYLLTEKQKQLKQEARGGSDFFGTTTTAQDKGDHFILNGQKRFIMGGIGYTNIYPVERIFRDLRLASIWTGTNEVMAMIIANEWYKAYWKDKPAGKIRDMEPGAAEATAADEKIFE